MTKVQLGEILKTARERSGLTRKLVAASIGKSVNLVGHWETGYSEPDVDTLFRLCDLYRISIDETFCGKRYRRKLLDEKEEEVFLLMRKLPKDKRAQMMPAIISALDALSEKTGIETPNSDTFTLSQDEQFIIDSYRSMTDAGRQYIRQTVTIAKDAYARPNEHTAAM